MKILRSLLQYLPFLSRRNPSVAPHLSGIEPARLGINHLWHEFTGEAALHRLLRIFMRRTVEFGGNYADIDVLQALRVETHPDKTFVGTAKKGFDFLGFHCRPTGVKVSDAALSLRETQVARLYEQGASKQRIAQYLVRWLGWAVAVGCVPCLAVGEIRVNGYGSMCDADSDFWRYVDITNGSGAYRTSAIGSVLLGMYGNWFPCDVIVRGESQIINITTNEGGTLSCTPAAPEYNLSTTCTATPDPGYTFSTWGDDCSAAGTTPTCTLNHVQTAKTVSATFTAIPGYVPSGPVVDIVVDPTTPTTLYSALDGGGVWKKVGAGDWTAATTQPANLNVKALAIKSDGITLYAGTDGGGVFKSTDSGVHWAACANTNLTNLNLRSLALTDATLYAGTEAGVFVSNDACATWAAMNNGLPQ